LTVSLLILLSSLSGCSMFSRAPEKEIVTVTKVEKPTIAVVERPKQLTMLPVYFYVVTPDTFDEFKQKFEQENGQLVFYALTVPSYENMALNMAELKRYLLQQKEIIIYYEQSVTDTPPPEEGK
jgi:hypothetical protein